MDMSGEYRIEASKDRVWAALNDTEILRQSIPGCEEVIKVSDTELTAKVVAKVGPVKAKFSGKVTFTDVDPPNGYRINGEGSGGAAGFAKGGATVKLTEDGSGTILNYVVDAHIGGKLAQIGSRLIDATSRKMADDFFARFKELVTSAEPAPAVATAAPVAPSAPEPTPAPAPAVPAATLAAEISPTPMPDPAPQVPPAPTPKPAASAPPPPAPEPARSGLSPIVWVAGLAVIVVAVLYFMNR